MCPQNSVVGSSEEPSPQSLNFTGGMVGSQEFPLRNSHEILQKSEILKIVRKNLMEKNKCLELSIEAGEDKRATRCMRISLKRGIHGDS